MLEDYIINEQIRYENHYLKVAQTDIQIGGVAGAALLSALIVDTEEGVRRGIAIDSDAERMAWIAKYEREVRREEWGLLGAEVELLNNAYIDLATSEVEWGDICPNVLLSDLALQLVTTYMRYLTVETFGNHIWEYEPWVEPFAVWTTYQAQVREIPGAQPRAARHRNFVVEQETNWLFLKDEIDALPDDRQLLWAKGQRGTKMQKMQYAYICFYPLMRLCGLANNMTEVAHSMLACTRDGYPHYAINPRDITKLAKQL